MPLHTRHMYQMYRSQVAETGTPSSGWLGAGLDDLCAMLPSGHTLRRPCCRHPASSRMRSDRCPCAPVRLQLEQEALEGAAQTLRCRSKLC